MRWSLPGNRLVAIWGAWLSLGLCTQCLPVPDPISGGRGIPLLSRGSRKGHFPGHGNGHYSGQSFKQLLGSQRDAVRSYVEHERARNASFSFKPQRCWGCLFLRITVPVLTDAGREHSFLIKKQ